jgi:hypothetical protein
MKKHRRLSAISWAIIVTLVLTSCEKESGSASVTTGPLVDITPVSAICKAQVLSEGIEPTWYRGIVWGTAPNPSLPAQFYIGGPSFNETLDWTFNAVKGTGPFEFELRNMKPNTKYWVRAFAMNKAGIAYGNELSFTSPELKVGMDLFNGKVLYIDSTGKHGLIVSYDLGKLVWHNGQYIKTEATSFTDGYSNTNTIVYLQKIDKQYAAALCFMLPPVDYAPTWFLPAKDQLKLLYSIASTIPGLSNGSYWSSTEHDEKQAWSQDFATGNQSLTDKATSLSVRAFRRF